MINKQNLWFLTLFSLILVLSIYYLTMPDEVLKTVKTQDNNTKELAYKTLYDNLEKKHQKIQKIIVAEQDEKTDLIEV